MAWLGSTAGAGSVAEASANRAATGTVGAVVPPLTRMTTAAMAAATAVAPGRTNARRQRGAAACGAAAGGGAGELVDVRPQRGGRRLVEGAQHRHRALLLGEVGRQLRRLPYLGEQIRLPVRRQRAVGEARQLTFGVLPLISHVFVHHARLRLGPDPSRVSPPDGAGSSES